MFLTQLTGLLKRVGEKEEDAIEDAGRLLAQSLVSEGTIYIKGYGEMAVIETEALHGAEVLKGVKSWTTGARLTDADRVLIATRFSDDPEAVQLAQKLSEDGVFFAAISSKKENAGLESLADAFIDIRLTKGILPDENGGRTGFPSSIAGLYTYFLLKMTIDDILAEYEEDM